MDKDKMDGGAMQKGKMIHPQRTDRPPSLATPRTR